MAVSHKPLGFVFFKRSPKMILVHLGIFGVLVYNENPFIRAFGHSYGILLAYITAYLQA